MSWRTRRKGTIRQKGLRFPIGEERKKLPKIKAAIPKKPKVEYIEEIGSGPGYHQIFKVNGEEVEIYPPARDEYEGYMLPWRVVWEGAVDFEGNKRDLLKRYPEFRGQI